MKVAILGAGPAGMSCALWLKNLGCQPVVLERDAVAGGLLRQNVLANDWVLGQSGLTGSAMARQFAEHLASSAISCHFGAEILDIAPSAGEFLIRVAGNATPIGVRAVVIATGTRVCGREWLDSLPGATDVPATRLIVGPAAFGEAERFTGQRLLIVGGGDNAHEFARFTAPFAAQQTLLVRGRRRAQLVQQEAVDALAAEGQLRVLEHARITSLSWVDGEIVATLVGEGAPAASLRGDALIVQAGYAPNTESVLAALEPGLRAHIQCDADGYLLADASGRTGCEGIYAIGDITNRDTPCVVTALAAGATAARAIERSFRNQP